MEHKKIGLVICMAVFLVLVIFATAGNALNLFSSQKTQKQVTYQGVLNMLRADNTGNCLFMEVPRYADLNSQYGISYKQADSNKDGVTTGIEFAASMKKTCLFGFRVEKVSAPEGTQYITNPIGCAGGPTIEQIQAMEFPLYEKYLPNFSLKFIHY